MGTELSFNSGPEGLEAGGEGGGAVLVSSVSVAFTHLPPPRPQGGAFQHLGLEAWGASQGPPFSAGPEAHRLSPEHHEVTDTQRSAGLGRVLAMFSDILPCQACARIFVFPAQGTVKSCVSQPLLLDFFPAFSSQSRLCSDAPREGAALSVSSSLSGLLFCLKSWIVAA